MPQLIDYIFVGRYLDCYECHSNRPGCGRELDWILQRWKRCDMPASKCVKIIEKIGCKTKNMEFVHLILKKFFLFVLKLKRFTFVVVLKRLKLLAQIFQQCV